jgi:hypothetical protein
MTTIVRKALARPVVVDPTLRQAQQVAYTYWPVSYQNGDPTVIAQTPLLLSGVQYSLGLRGVGQLTASLQLADAGVRAMNPWACVIPRKTGIVVIRTVTDPTTGAQTSKAMAHYIVWAAPTDPTTGRMSITANTVESAWAKRLITGTVAIRVKITPLASYTFSSTYNGTATFTPQMQCDWFAGTTPLSSTIQSPGAIPTGAVTISTTHTAPAGATGVRVSIYVNAMPIGAVVSITNVFFGPATTTTNFISNFNFLGADLSGWSALNASTLTGNASDFASVTSTTTATATGFITTAVLSTNAIVSTAPQWHQADQQAIAADLLNPAKWSQIPVNTGTFPGWITVDPPTVPTNVLRDLSYTLNAQVNLLTAHVDRSTVINGYEWYTTLRVLTGGNPLDASVYRLQFILGYPRCGAQAALGQPLQNFQSRIDGTGNVISYGVSYDGTNVANIVWGAGQGYQSSQVQSLSTNSLDWTNGFLQTEGQYSDPNVSVQATLQAYSDALIVTELENERFFSGLTVRGDLPPTLDTYSIGDDILVTMDDWIWPDQTPGARQISVLTRVTGYVVTPPEGGKSELVSILANGGNLGG